MDRQTVRKSLRKDHKRRRKISQKCPKIPKNLSRIVKFWKILKNPSRILQESFKNRQRISKDVKKIFQNVQKSSRILQESSKNLKRRQKSSRILQESFRNRERISKDAKHPQESLENRQRIPNEWTRWPRHNFRKTAAITADRG